MSSEKTVPTWAWAGCGCLGALAALVIVAVGLGVWGVRRARELGEELADPEARLEKSLEVLGATELPEGYHPVIAFSVPFLFDLAILSDRPPGEEGRPPGLGARGFIYMAVPSFGQQDEELEHFFEGKIEDVEALRRQEINVDLEERLSSGSISRAEDELLWVTHRGRVDRDNGAGDRDQGIVTLFLVQCPDDDRRRLGIWFGPDPDPAAPPEELDLTGTVGDPEAIDGFMEPLRPCVTSKGAAERGQD